MIKIFIQGLKDGVYEVNQVAQANSIPDIFSEFFGEIVLKGQLRKLGNKYTFTGTVECNALLICDLSLVEFKELIKAEIHACFIADNSMLKLSSKDINTEFNEYFIGEDDKYIDLTNEVREELAVNLPMKRVAPQFRDKSFEELYPMYSANSQSSNSPQKKKKATEIDDRWDALKKLKFN